MAAITNAVSRNTSNVALPKELSAEIWAKTIEASAIMQLAQKRTLPGAGQEIQMIASDVEANWVGETDAIASASPTFSKKSWKGYNLGVIVPFSNEFRRDKEALYNEILLRAPKKLGEAFDKTVFGIKSAPGELFSTLADCTSINIETDTWNSVVTADATVSANDGILSGWALAPQAKAMLMKTVDTQGRPLFIDSMTDAKGVSSIMGQPTYITKGLYKAPVTAGTKAPSQLGFAGDWENAFYGVVQDISMSITDQATITIDGAPVHLFERNMFAVKFNFEAGFIVKDAGQFIKLTGNTPA